MLVGRTVEGLAVPQEARRHLSGPLARSGHQRSRCRADAHGSGSSGHFASHLLGLALSRYVLKLPPLVALEREDFLELVGPVLQLSLTGEAGS